MMQFIQSRGKTFLKCWERFDLDYADVSVSSGVSVCQQNFISQNCTTGCVVRENVAGHDALRPPLALIWIMLLKVMING